LLDVISKCVDDSEPDQATSRRNSKVQDTTTSDGEEFDEEQGVKFDCKVLLSETETERVQLPEDRGRRIKALEDGLLVMREELEKEKHYRMRLESENRKRDGQVNQKPDDGLVVEGQSADMDMQQDCRRNETEDKWAELQSAIKKIQEDVSEIRDKAAQGRPDNSTEPRIRLLALVYLDHTNFTIGIKEAIEELHKENVEQRKLLDSLVQCSFAL
jgi:hypothetical protein